LIEDWEMGIGNFTEKINTNSATWLRKKTEENWAQKGGDYDSSTKASQSFNFAPTDVRMDITNIFNYWKSNDNFGIIVKRPDLEESGSIQYGSLSFYSMDTHTVYLPTLEVLYDDSIYDTSEFLVWNKKIYSTTSNDNIDLDSLRFKFKTNSNTAMSLGLGNKEFTIGDSLDFNYIPSIPIYIKSNVSQSAIMEGTVLHYNNITGDITASITSVQGPTGSYNDWYVDTPPGFTMNPRYKNLSFIIGTDLPYEAGQKFIMTASFGNKMEGNVIAYNSITGNMTASISLVEGTGSFSSWNVELSPEEEPGYTVTGSVSGSLITGSISVHMKNLQPTYRYNEKVRFEVIIKESYQKKTFYEKASVGEIYYLPKDSLQYSIRDAYSNRVMIPFSEYTKVSLDSTGHFFNVSLSGFMPERFYKILFKYIDENNVERYFDKNSQFKVVK